MRIERKLAIYGDRQTLNSLVSRLEKILCDGWSRDRARERLPIYPYPQYCFLCGSNSECSPFVLLLGDEGHRLTVSDIAPKNTCLSLDQYNRILVEFFLKFLHPAASDLPLTFDLSSDERSIEEVIGWKAAQLLRRFSSIARGSVAHPADRRRWWEFIVHLHLHPERDYELSLIERWLMQERWSPDKTSELMDELRLAQDLLRIYDHNLTAGLTGGCWPPTSLPRIRRHADEENAPTVIRAGVGTPQNKGNP